MRQGLLGCTRVLIPKKTPRGCRGLPHAGTDGNLCHTRAFSMGGAAGAPLGERLDTHADTSHWTASDPGIHHAPRVMAPVVGRAAEGSGDGTLAA